MDKTLNKVKNKLSTATQASKPKGTEKRRNNEKRKEKSRDAARCRRSRETEIFTDLAGALPVRREDIEQLDKASVMRLSIAYLKVRNMLEFFPNIQEKCKMLKKQELDTEFNVEELIAHALDGFLFVLSSDGDIIYVSDIISEYLGIQQIDMIGQQVWDYSHQCDHDELRDILKGKRNGDLDVKSQHRDFFLRLKCTLTSRGRNVNIKSASYKVIHVTGHIVVNENGERIMISVGRAVPHPSNIEVPLDSSTFLTKHSLDMKFSYVDDKMLSLLGYSPDHLLNKSLYEYHHSADSENLLTSFKNVISKGQSETCRYRFLARTGGYSWVVTQATLVYDKQKPQSVVCVNYIVSGIENENEIYSCAQLEAHHQLLANETADVQQAVTLADNLKCATAAAAAVNKPLTEIKLNQDIQKNTDESLIDLQTKAYYQQQQIKLQSIAVKENNRPRSVTASVFCQVADLQPPVAGQPKSVTGSVFASSSSSSSGGAAVSRVPSNNNNKPQSITSKLFAPRSSDMNKFFDDVSAELTMLKEEPDELSHLAPTAGDACIPLEDATPLFGEMFEGLILPDGYGSLLQDDVNSLDSHTADKPMTSDPFINYRDDSCDTPNLLSPGGTKSANSSSLPSLCSPNSMHHEDEFAFMTMNCEEEIDLAMRAPYIPMNENDDLPLLTEDLMWSAFTDDLQKDIRDTTNAGETIIKESSLAALLSPDGMMGDAIQNAQIDFKRNRVFITKRENENADDMEFSHHQYPIKCENRSFTKNESVPDAWRMNNANQINNISSNSVSAYPALVQTYKNQNSKKIERIANQNNSSSNNNNINKRPLSTSVADLITSKRMKTNNSNTTTNNIGKNNMAEIRTSPQLLQQLIATTTTTTTTMPTSMKVNAKENNIYYKNDLRKWNGLNGTQNQQMPTTRTETVAGQFGGGAGAVAGGGNRSNTTVPNVEPISNSVLKNLLENLSMKPPDILLADNQQDEKRLNLSNSMDTKRIENIMLCDPMLNEQQQQMKRTSTTNNMEIMMMAQNNSFSAAPRQSNINTIERNDIGTFGMDRNLSNKQMLPPQKLPFHNAQKDQRMLETMVTIGDDDGGGIRNGGGPQTTIVNGTGFNGNSTNNDKIRKISFSSLDGDILPIPIQSLLMELSDQDFELSLHDDGELLMDSPMDDWTSQMT